MFQTGESTQQRPIFFEKMPRDTYADPLPPLCYLVTLSRTPSPPPPECHVFYECTVLSK
jgi:hypothetical protein